MSAELEHTVTVTLDLLNQCKRFSTDALVKYSKKINMFEVELSVDDVYTLHQKIEIVEELLRRLIIRSVDDGKNC